MVKKLRKIKFHRRLSLLLAIVLSLVIIIAVLKRSVFLPYQISKYVNEHYFKNSPFKFSCSRVSGDFVNLIKFHKLALEYDDGRDAYTVFWVDEVEVNYQLSQLIGMKLFIDDLVMKDVRIRVEQDEAGRLVLPIPASAPDQGGASVSPHIEVNQFNIDGLMVFFSGGKRNLRLRDVSLSGSLRYLNNAGTLVVDNGTGYLIDTETSIHSFRTQVDFGGQDVQLREFVTRLDHSYILATGGYLDGQLKHLQVVFNPVDLKELSDMGILPPNQGQLGGNIICDGPIDSLSLKGSLTGTGWGLVFGGFSFEGALTRNQLVFSNVDGTVFGSRVSGELIYDFGERGGFVFDGSCAGLDLSQGFIPSDDTPDTDLFGAFRVEYRREADIYRFQAELDSATVAGFETNQLTVQGSYQGDTGARFETIELRRPGFVASASGQVDLETRADLLFEVQGESLDYLWRYLSLPRIGGWLGVSGRMTGPLNNFQINLNGEFQDLSYLFASINRGTVQAQINDAPSDSVSVTVDLLGEKIALGGRAFDQPHVLLDAGSSGTVFRDFSFTKGDTSITMDFDLQTDPSGTLVRFKHLSIASEGEEWNITRPFELDLSEQTARLDSLVLSSRYGTIGFVGDYSTESRMCRFLGWGESIDLTLIKEALNLPIIFQGRGDFNLMVDGELDNPQADLNISLGRGQIDSLSFDHLELHGSFTAGAGYRLDRLTFLTNGDSLTAAGSWSYSESPVRIIRTGFDREKAFGYPLALKAEFVRYPLADIFRGLHLNIIPSGVLTGTVAVGKTARNPELNLAGIISGAEKGGLHLPAINCNLVYGDSALSINKVEFNDGITRGNLQGTLPVAINMFNGLSFMDDRPIRLNCEIYSKNISSLQPYFDQIGEASGELNAAVSLNGSFNNPSFGGNITFRKSSVRLSGMEVLYKNIDANIELNQNRIELSTLAGRDEEKGRFNGSGFVRLAGFKPDWYDLELQFQELSLSPSQDISSTVDGTVKIVSASPAPDRLIPSLTGSIYVREAQVQLSLETGQGGSVSISGPTASPGWIANIDIEAPKNVWVRNPDLRMELGGEVIFKRDERGKYLRGEFQVLRGTYNLYNNKFRITQGSFDFSKGYAFRPEMFLDAYTPYRREGGQEHRIYLRVSWPSDKLEPEVTLSYDEPGYSETDIWRMLGGGSPAGADQAGDGSWDATGTAQGFASNYLERILSEQMTDLTIEVETQAPGSRYASSNQDHEMSIAVGKYLSEDLYLKYRQGLSVGSAREVDIEYRLSNMLLIRSEIIRHSDKLYFGQRRQVTDEINLDIKFRFEY